MQSPDITKMLNSITPPRLVTKTIILIYDLPTSVSSDFTFEGIEGPVLMYFKLINNELFCDSVELSNIAARVPLDDGTYLYAEVFDLEPEDNYLDAAIPLPDAVALPGTIKLEVSAKINVG